MGHRLLAPEENLLSAAAFEHLVLTKRHRLSHGEEAAGLNRLREICGLPRMRGGSNLTTHLLFQHLNLSYPGMETVAAALKAGDNAAACNAISDHYSHSSKVSWLRYPEPKAGSTSVGGQIDEVVANDTYTFVTETGRVPRNKDGGLDWEYSGPINDAEWRFELNRHNTWVQLLQAWLQTGNQDYAAAVDALVVDWTRHNLPAPTVLSAGGYTPGCIKDADPGHPSRGQHRRRSATGTPMWRGRRRSGLCSRMGRRQISC
eukprot:COSAG01_NODE_14154_length_1490_cov_1.433501_2_plen_260_part_00